MASAVGAQEEAVAGGGAAGGEDVGVGAGEQVGGVGGEGRQCVVDGLVGGVRLDAAQSLGLVPGEEGAVGTAVRASFTACRDSSGGGAPSTRAVNRARMCPRRVRIRWAQNSYSCTSGAVRS